MTTTALKKIDDIGGIDNYIMNLDERSVEDSNYVTKMRGLIGAALHQKGKLSDRMSKRLGVWFVICITMLIYFTKSSTLDTIL